MSNTSVCLPNLPYDRVIDIHLSETLKVSFGILVVWPGVAEVWAQVSDYAEAQDYTVPIVRAARKLMNEVRETYGLHRIQATVVSGYPAHENFVLALGFKFEGLARAATPDKRDLLRFAKVWLH